MAQAQPLNATFFAFKKREKGGVLVGTTVAYVLLAAVLVAAFVALNWSAMAAVFSWYGNVIQQSVQNPGAPPDMSGIAAFSSIGGAYFLFMLAYYILFAAYEAACLKWLVRGETGGFFGLSLGADTWRVWLSYWVWLVVLLGFYFLFFIALAVAGGGAFVAMGGGGDKNGAAGGAAALVMILVCLAVFAAVIYVAVRLAPATATSIIAKRFAFFDAWKATKGRFWSLFGAFVLLWVLYFISAIIIEIVIGIVAGGTMAATFGGAGGNNTDPSAVFAALTSPTMLVVFGLIYVAIFALAMTFLVAMYGVNARAAIAAAEEGKLPGVAPPQAQVFS